MDSSREKLKDFVIQNEKATYALRVMTDEETRQFDEERIPFGKYEGEKISNVRLSYLALWNKQTCEFAVDVRRYLLSERIQRETLDADGLDLGE